MKVKNNSNVAIHLTIAGTGYTLPPWGSLLFTNDSYDEVMDQVKLYDTLSTEHTDDAYLDVTLTTAQILALNTTPITLIPAPGASQVLILQGVYGINVFNSVAYVSAALEFRYTNGSGTKLAELTSGFVQSASTALAAVNVAVAQMTPVANAPLVAFVGTANPTTGNGSIKLRLYYKLVPAML
jgi:hypothetical protein